MSTPVQLVGLSGSLRKGSFNTQLLASVTDLLPDDTSLTIVNYDDVPIYNADQDLPAVSQRPDPVTRIREIMAGADGFIIVSPEYNYSVPGGLKNLIDWASRGEDSPLRKKPVALMGVTPGQWGTVRMQLAFHPIFQFLDMKPVLQPEVLIGNAAEKFENGRLADKKSRELVEKKVKALVDVINNHRQSA